MIEKDLRPVPANYNPGPPLCDLVIGFPAEAVNCCGEMP